MTSPSSTSSSDEPREEGGGDARRADAIPAEDGSAQEATAATTPTPAAVGRSSSRRALILCLGVLLLLEFGAARRDWLWRLDPRRPVGILLAVEDEIIAPAGEVSVVALGSSVMRDALLPRNFEAAARLPEGSVLNLSLPNATPFDFVLLYERNRDVIAGAELLLVGIEDWFFYEEPGVSERYHRWASLSDRLTDYDGSARLPVLVSWGWKTYAARQAFAIDGLAAAVRGEPADVIGDDGRTKWRPREQEAGTETFDLAPYEARLREREWRDRQVRYLRDLVELAGADGVPIAMVRMPMRTAAFRLRGQVDPQAEPRLQEAMSAAVGSSEPAPAVLVDVPTGELVGLQENLFLDERHLGTRGARTFSAFLGEWAAANHALR